MSHQEFQSSPTPKGGRYVGCLYPQDVYLDVSILAHPERWALHTGIQHAVVHLHVSILAHPERWALRGPIHVRSGLLSCFNPRPPRKVGATSIMAPFVAGCRVFQSSPTPKGGRYDVAG